AYQPQAQCNQDGTRENDSKKMINSQDLFVDRFMISNRKIYLNFHYCLECSLNYFLNPWFDKRSPDADSVIFNRHLKAIGENVKYKTQKCNTFVKPN
ncbi:MAG: hypothetical protein P8Y40_02650, partial [Desulfobacterales bacterium]